MHAHNVFVFLKYLDGVGQSEVLVLYLLVELAQLLHGLSGGLRVLVGRGGGSVEVSNPFFAAVDLGGEVLCLSPECFDGGVYVLALPLYEFVGLCDGCVVSIDSLLLLPQVVLHGSDRVLHKLAVLDLLINVGLFVADVGYLAFDGLYERGVVTPAADFRLNLHLVGSDPGLHLTDDLLLPLNYLLRHFLHICCLCGTTAPFWGIVCFFEIGWLGGRSVLVGRQLLVNSGVGW